MTIPSNIIDREIGKFKESSSYPGEIAVKVVNPDGSNVSSGGGGGDATAANQVIGNASLASIDSKLTSPITTKEQTYSVSTLTNVASTTSSTTLAASNINRKGLIIYNDSNRTLFIKYGATASSTSFTVKIIGDGVHYMSGAIYTGVVDGIWSAVNGSARVTEIS